MIQQGTQVRANCFHFLRQVQILQKAGGGSAESQFIEARTVCFFNNRLDGRLPHDCLVFSFFIPTADVREV